MSCSVAVLRPEPGNARTAAAIEAAGLTAIRLPLFAVAPVAWEAPEPAGFDALLLTSANALRHGGGGLTLLRSLPVHAVGEATAAAARAAGFAVMTVGTSDAATLVAGLPAGTRLLHLAGRERGMLPGVTALTVYAADPLPIDTAQCARLAGSVALLHSARAAARLATIVPPELRATMRLAAISAAVAATAGQGWQQVATATRPRDDAMIALAHTLAD